MKKESISIVEARKLALSHQGLLSSKPKFGRGKKAVLKAIQHLGYIQIDAISVIQRAHHHTLWSRIPGYRPNYLGKLLNVDRTIFEYWSHAASFLPMEDYRFSLPMMHSVVSNGKHWYRVDPELKKQVLYKIREEGPLFARDFETPKLTPGIMWNWKPAKKALHELFMEGKIMVKSRDGFQRLYDLTDRCIPPRVDRSYPSPREHIKYSIYVALKAHGLVTAAEIAYHHRVSKAQIQPVLKEMVAEGKLLAVTLPASVQPIYFVQPQDLEQLPVRVYKQVHLLSPFDNAVIQRKRIKQLFGFDYQTEIYYPSQKRVYGYFSMPILYGTDFVGRIDPKAVREKKTLEIRNIALEPRFRVTDTFIKRLKQRVREFALFNECEQVSYLKTTPRTLKTALN